MTLHSSLTQILKARRTGFVAATALVLSACGQADEPSEVAIVEVPSAETEIEAEVETIVAEMPEAPAMALIAGPTLPQTEFRGTATVGAAGEMNGIESGTVIDDNNGELLTYVAFTEVLEPGQYRVSGLYDLSCEGGQTCQTVMRVRPPASASEFRIVNAFLGSDGQSGGATGSMDDFSIMAEGDAHRVTLDFTVVDGDEGQYRVFLIPTAAVENTYDPAYMGELTVADLNLVKL